jgi:hypothetical protein
MKKIILFLLFFIPATIFAQLDSLEQTHYPIKILHG